MAHRCLRTNPGYLSVRRCYGYYRMLSRKAHKPVLVRPWLKAVVIVTAAFACLALYFREPVLMAVGDALVARDLLQETDCIVVLMGSIPDRIVHAVELYRQGYGKSIVMVRSHDFSNYELIDELDLDLPGGADINRDIALQLGVLEEDLIILGARADSTWEEATVFREYMRTQGIRSLVLVTSRSHSARAKKTFEKVLGDGCRILSSPSPYDPFDPADWWKHRRYAKQVFFEYQKLLNLSLFQ